MISHVGRIIGVACAYSDMGMFKTPAATFTS